MPAKAVERPRVPTGEPVSVLLVDDEPALLKTTQRMLEQRGFRVTSVDTAEAALELVAARSFDLLMTDVALRRTRGTELARRARLVQPGLRVLYVSGFDESSVELGDSAQCRDAFLAKPYTPRELDDRLRDLLLPTSGQEDPGETASTRGVTARDRLR
jgi:DNA-binding response OmpR family regulator